MTATRPTEPADTRMMGIVHSALRRDLVRARLVLAEPTPLTGERRTALADHVRWLMDFLHHHHTNEDDGLFPMVLEKNPAAGELLGVMDADHDRIAPRILELGRRRPGVQHRAPPGPTPRCSTPWRPWRPTCARTSSARSGR